MAYEKSRVEWLFRIFNRMHHDRIKDEFIKQNILEASHPHILFILKYEMDGMKASQKDLCDKLGLSPSTVAISLKRMEKNDLIKKQQDRNDLRRNVITLTDKGHAIIKQCKEVFSKTEKQLFSNFSEVEKDLLKTYYLRMIYNLEEMGAKLPEMYRVED